MQIATFSANFLQRNRLQFEKMLREIMGQVVSSPDMGKYPESFYHGLMLGLTASIHGGQGYELKSNRESGDGLYNYIIFAEGKNKLSLIFEFKKIGADKKHSSEAETLLAQSAKKALEQITRKKLYRGIKTARRHQNSQNSISILREGF